MPLVVILIGLLALGGGAAAIKGSSLNDNHSATEKSAFEAGLARNRSLSSVTLPSSSTHREMENEIERELGVEIENADIRHRDIEMNITATAINREQAIEIARGQLNGAVERVEQEVEDGILVWKVRIANDTGVRTDIQVNTNTGEIVRIKTDDADIRQSKVEMNENRNNRRGNLNSGRSSLNSRSSDDDSDDHQNRTQTQNGRGDDENGNKKSESDSGKGKNEDNNSNSDRGSSGRDHEEDD